jgi:hypothetical protein
MGSLGAPELLVLLVWGFGAVVALVHLLVVRPKVAAVTR